MSTTNDIDDSASSISTDQLIEKVTVSLQKLELLELHGTDGLPSLMPVRECIFQYIDAIPQTNNAANRDRSVRMWDTQSESTEPSSAEIIAKSAVELSECLTILAIGAPNAFTAKCIGRAARLYVGWLDAYLLLPETDPHYRAAK